MVATSQQTALARVLAHEGGNVDDPRDPGGRTSRGVTQRVYDAWRRGKGQPPRDVFLATMTEVRAIYLEQYWRRVRADELPAGLDYAIFDAAVNSGPVQAVKWLQRELGVRADGVVGQVTLAATRSHPAIAALITAVCARRMAFLKQLRTWRRFGAGWTNRVADVERTALMLAAGSKQVPLKRRPVPGNGGARADPAQIRLPAGAGLAQTIAGAGLATAAAAETLGDSLRQAATELGQAAQQLPAFAAMASMMTALGLVLLVAGVGWRLYVAWRWRLIDGAMGGVMDGTMERGSLASRIWGREPAPGQSGGSKFGER